jgi:hypothetical protein
MLEMETRSGGSLQPCSLTGIDMPGAKISADQQARAVIETSNGAEGKGTSLRRWWPHDQGSKSR